MCLPTTRFPKAPIELLTKLEKRKIGIYRERFAVLGRGHSRKGGGSLAYRLPKWCTVRIPRYPVSAKSFELQLQQKMKKSLFYFAPGALDVLYQTRVDSDNVRRNTIHASQCCRYCTSSPRQLFSAIPHEWLNKKVKVDKRREMNILIDTQVGAFILYNPFIFPSWVIEIKSGLTGLTINILHTHTHTQT